MTPVMRSMMNQNEPQGSEAPAPMGEQPSEPIQTITVDKQTMPDAKVGDQVSVSAMGTVKEVGDQITLELSDVTANANDEAEMGKGFDQATKE